MASNSLNGHLLPLLKEGEYLSALVLRVDPGDAEGPLKIAALNRAVVIACVSSWEAYIEELVRESLAAVRP